MVWPTLGSRTANEQNRTSCRLQLDPPTITGCHYHVRLWTVTVDAWTCVTVDVWEITGTRVYLVPSNFCNWLPVRPWTVTQAQRDPRDASHPTLGDQGDPIVFGPLQLLQLAAVFSQCTVGRLYSASKDLLAEFKGGG